MTRSRLGYYFEKSGWQIFSQKEYLKTFVAILKNNNIWISKNTAATFGAFLEKIGVLLFHRHQDALLASKKNV